MSIFFVQKKEKTTMNEKKYILTDVTINFSGRTLHRIQAVKDFGNVKAGDLGGWIESEENLSQEGTCWVSGEARVFDKARIYDEAEVFGNISITGTTTLRTTAYVQSQYDLLSVEDIGSRNGTTTFYKTKTGGVDVACGCFRGSIEEFEKAVEKTHGDNEHGRVYRHAVKFAKIVLT